MQVLITGANRGLGLALSENYQADGHNVIGTYRSTAPDAPGTWLPLDVTDPESHAQLADRLSGQPIDFLMCNAGVYLDKGDSLGAGYEAQKWADTYAANVMGVFLTIEALLPNLRLSQNPRIGIMSSMMAARERAKGSALIYRTSKAAVASLGFNMANTLRGDGIAVGVVEPGWVATDMGGTDADLTVAQSIPKLRANLDAICMETTGHFTAISGEPHPH